MTKSIVISSGHGKYIRGASGYLDEVNEARRVVDRVAELLRAGGVTVKTFHDDQSHSQDENLNRIVNYHNGQQRELDVSVHFNAYQTTSSPTGTECLFLTQEALADDVAEAIAKAGGLIDRGPKYRDNLYFLKNTSKPSVMVETVFVDSRADADIYNTKFEAICHALAEALAGNEIEAAPPTELPLPPPQQVPPAGMDRPTLAKGDMGQDVIAVQTSLGIPADGDFGPTTEGAVKGYQAAYGLTADGVVGPKTWAALDALDAAKAAGNDRLPQEQVNVIVKIANDSAISRYSWKDRGVLPKGYTAGLAVCFGLAATRLMQGHPTAVLAAQADRNDSDEDALSWYREPLEKIGMDVSEAGIDTLRALFVLMLGLGARESSGRYCEGRDMSASNVSADTAEASIYQTSWNIRSCSSHIGPLLQDYWANPNGFLPVFRNGVVPDSNDLGNYGTGDGAKYQFLSKFAPAFHVFVTGVGLRYLRQHWGPINRHDAEVKAEANEMLLAVQHYLSDRSAETVVSAP